MVRIASIRPARTPDVTAPARNEVMPAYVEGRLVWYAWRVEERRRGVRVVERWVPLGVLDARPPRTPFDDWAGGAFRLKAG